MSDATIVTSEPAFFRSSTEEPHLRRRKAILAEHPEVRALCGYDRNTIWITLLVGIAQLALAYGVARSELSYWLVLPLAYFVGSVLSHWSAMSIHETSHNLAARASLGNRAVAWLANLSMVLPMAETFRRYHLKHHTHLGVEEEDSDLPRAVEVRWIGAGRIAKLLWLLVYPVAYLIRGASYAGRLSRAEALHMAFMLAVNLALYEALGWRGMVYLALSTAIGHGPHPVAAHFIHEHYVFAPGQETFSYYGILNWVTFNVGYHYEHHDLPSIPGSRLPAYRRITDKHYADLVSHTSWTWVLWHFVTSRVMGAHSRIVRTREVHDLGRQRAASRDSTPSPA